MNKSLSHASLERLRAIDRWYGITAGLVIVSGVALLFFGLKPSGFFTRNPVFWIKMALFVTVALLSIPLTVRLIRSDAASGTITFGDTEFRRFRALLWAQASLFAFIPLCAAFMANGILPSR